MKSWTLPVKENENGELYIELSDEILEGSGFKIGDTLNWKDLKDGSYSLTKAENDLYMVDCYSIFHIRHAVRARTESDALDEVTMGMDSLTEFSQKHLDTNAMTARKITQEEYLELFNKDNAYLSNWTDEQKMKFINEIDYESN